MVAFAGNIAHTIAPPVMEARRWIAGRSFPDDHALINLSQAAPVAPPPPALLAAMADMLGDPATHLYGPVLGLPDLREGLAASMQGRYAAPVRPDQIAITAGCNQAFCAVMATLAGQGDAVVLPTPWYFNHAMWLSMQGIDAVPLPCGAGLLPDPDHARTLIGPRTRAIVLVSPNNPTGAEYPPALIAAFRDLARSAGIALVVDETYRDFHSVDGAPHDLFADPDWDDTVISLYSFSKAYRLTGHRVGAMATSPARLAQVEKFLDTVSICAPGLGQRAALWGLQHLGEWLAGERAEILRRRDAMIAGFRQLDGWRLLGCGAYFAYVAHPFALPAPDLARAMVDRAHLLALPGTMFAPEGDAAAKGQMRLAFANADLNGIGQVITRLQSFAP